jgi:hypothetical protein
MKRPYYTAVLWVIIGVIFTLSYAYASQAEKPVQRGEGTGHVSGITVTNIEYRLSSIDPSRVDAVAFDVTDFQGKISVKLVSTSSVYYSCTPQSGDHWLCPVTGVNVASIDTVRVVASGI